MRPRVVVVGAWPHALTVSAYLLDARPDTDLVVADRADWLAAWDRCFAAYGLRRLRSGCVHHPHPDPFALLDFARVQQREDEFTEEIRRPSTERAGRTRRRPGGAEPGRRAHRCRADRARDHRNPGPAASVPRLNPPRQEP
jgi:hypothetical protein